MAMSQSESKHSGEPKKAGQPNNIAGRKIGATLMYWSVVAFLMSACAFGIIYMLLLTIETVGKR